MLDYKNALEHLSDSRVDKCSSPNVKYLQITAFEIVFIHSISSFISPVANLPVTRFGRAMGTLTTRGLLQKLLPFILNYVFRNTLYLLAFFTIKMIRKSKEIVSWLFKRLNIQDKYVKMNHYLRLSIILYSITFNSNCVFSQDYYQDYDFVPQNEKISPHTPESELKEFLKRSKAKTIEFTEQSSKFPIRIKKKNSWALLEPEWKYEEAYGEADSSGFSEIYFINHLVGYYIVEKKGFSLHFQDSVIHEFYNFIIAESKGKKYAAEINTNEIVVFPTWFDEIEPVIDSMQVYIDTEAFDRTLITKTISNTLMLKRGNKWALFAYSIPVLSGNPQLLQLTGFHFNRIEEIPQKYYANYIEESGEGYMRFDVDLLLQAKQYFEAYPELDYVKPIWETNSGKQLFAIHSTKNNLWSILPNNVSNELSFPNGVSELKILEDEVIAFRDKDKLGFYNSDLSQRLPCEFDEYQSVFLDYFNGCAFRKGNQWELYDCYNLTKLVEGSAPTIEVLIELWLNR